MKIYINKKLSTLTVASKPELKKISFQSGEVVAHWADGNEGRLLIIKDGKTEQNEYYYEGKDAIAGDIQAKESVLEKLSNALNKEG